MILSLISFFSVGPIGIAALAGLRIIILSYRFCFTLNKLNTRHTVGTGFGLCQAVKDLPSQSTAVRK